jgi:hypothetical protein
MRAAWVRLGGGSRFVCRGGGGPSWVHTCSKENTAEEKTMTAMRTMKISTVSTLSDSAIVAAIIFIPLLDLPILKTRKTRTSRTTRKTEKAERTLSSPPRAAATPSSM